MHDFDTAHGEGISVAFVTLGCAKNEVDSQNMAKALLDAGIAVTEELEDADCIVVNTCSFIQAATEESLAAIFEAADLESVASGQAKLVIAGCMPSRYGDELAQELPEAAAFVTCAGESDIVSVVEGLFPGRTSRCEAGGVFAAPSAYVKISDGCDRFCSFCTIPFIRGRYHSFAFDDIVRACEEAIQGGARELVLIAQDTGRWGSDFAEPKSLAWLLEALAGRFSETWIRVMYIQPEGITDELLDVVARMPNICSYFDVPLQHCNERIIASMNRTGNAQSYLELVARMRERVPGAIVRTTLISGYPGETEADFEELLDFLEQAEFDYVGVFPYSAEEGTRAAKLADQNDEETKVERATRIRDLCDAISSARLADFVGKEVDVLVLGTEEDGQLYGRGMHQAPDVDGVVYVPAGEVGDIVRVTITDTLLYEMEGE